MAKNIYSDDVLFVLSKGDKYNEYDLYYFYYKDKDSVYEAFDAICQIIKDIKAKDNKDELPTA